MKKATFKNLPEKYKYSIEFTSRIKPIVSEESDKYISKASVENYRKYLPKDLNLEEKYDCLGFAGEAFIANKLNLNNDGVKTEQAIKIAKLLPYSLIDVEHYRSNIIGVVTNASFAEVGTGKEIKEEDLKDIKTPFCVVIGGLLWKLSDDKVVEEIESSVDPESLASNKYFFSWELAVSDYNLILMEGNKTNFEDGSEISNAAEKEQIETNSVSGQTTKDGLKIGRIVTDCIPIGMGVVENPAGQLKNIIVNTEDNVSISLHASKETEKTKEQEQNIIENKEIISHSNNDIVKIDRKGMKISKIEDITEESLKEIKASDLTSFYNEKLQEAAVKFQDKNEAHEKALTKIAELETNQNSITTELNSAKEELKKIRDEQAKAAALEVFNQRMTYFNDTYELDAEDRKIIVEDIKDLSEEAFASYKTKMEKLLAAKSKEVIKAAQEAKANKEDLTKEQISTELEKAKEDKINLPNSTETKKETLAERARKAFNLENVVIKNK